jgi:hypothetical protein
VTVIGQQHAPCPILSRFQAKGWETTTLLACALVLLLRTPPVILSPAKDPRLPFATTEGSDTRETPDSGPNMRIADLRLAGRRLQAA